MLKLGIRWLYSFYCVSRLYGLVLLLLFIVFKLEWEYETSLIFYITVILCSHSMVIVLVVIKYKQNMKSKCTIIPKDIKTEILPCLFFIFFFFFSQIKSDVLCFVAKSDFKRMLLFRIACHSYRNSCNGGKLLASSESFIVKIKNIFLPKT